MIFSISSIISFLTNEQLAEQNSIWTSFKFSQTHEIFWHVILFYIVDQHIELSSPGEPKYQRNYKVRGWRTRGGNIHMWFLALHINSVLCGWYTNWRISKRYIYYYLYTYYDRHDIRPAQLEFRSVQISW